MQAYRENSSYLSNYRLGNERTLENERQLLAQEQKLCKARARKFSLETNRRRKALDERRNQLKIQEQLVRERILLQRKQQVKDATQRFQRAHLPLSQRFRQSLRRNVPNIEDALSQIQGSFGSYNQPSLLSSTTNISRTCTSSPKPPAVSKSSHRQALSAVEAYTKLLQEQCRMERLQDDSLQGSHESDCSYAESLSSKDSLENDDPNQSTSDLQGSFSSFYLDSEKTHSEMTKQNDLCPTSASFSAMMFLNENLVQLRKLNEPKQEKQEFSDWTNTDTVVSKAYWGLESIERKTKTENEPIPHDSNLLTPCKLPNEDPKHFEVKSFQRNHSNNISVTNRVVIDDAVESSGSKQEALVVLKEQKISDGSHLKHQTTTDISVPSKSGKDILFGTPPKNSTADHFLNNRAHFQTEKEAYYLSSQKEPCASINNLNKISNSEYRTEKAISAASLQNASLSNIQSEMHKCSDYHEKEETSIPVSKASSHSVCEVRFIKGILKKQTKHLSEDTSCRHGLEHLIFAKHVALAIKDSVELTRAKTKNMEVNNAVKKKLRWFDEVHTRNDHQPSLSAESESPKPGHNMTPAASTGYHFTKEAWADVGVQVNLPQKPADEVKVAHSSTRTNGPKIPQRDCSARVGRGPVPPRTRKGTVMRPQSATEVNQIAKTQGKIIVPRPPTRAEFMEEKTPLINRTPYGMNCKQAPAVEEALPRNNSVRVFSPNKHVITTDSTVVYTPQPHLCTCPFSEGNTKSTPISGHRQSHNNRGREKGLCLDVTPTDEEILQLWHGVRSALITKDDKNIPKIQAQESHQVSRKPSANQSRQSPASGNRRLLQTSQPAKQNVELRTGAFACNTEGFETAAQCYLDEVHTEGVGVMDTAQTLRPGTVQPYSQQHGLNTISLEEKKILLSLDKLNHHLYCLQEHMQCKTCTHGMAIINAPFVKEEKVTSNYKHRASSANHVQNQKKV